MPNRFHDPLLFAGKAIATGLQGVCGLAAILALLALPVIILASQDMLGGFFDASDLPILEAAPIAYPGVALFMAVSFTALFLFFGRMRAIIATVSEGDPFIPENARRLNAMAWLLLTHEIAAVIIGQLRLYGVNAIDPDGGHSIDYSPYDLNGLLMVLVLFILARVFQRGAEMREDLEATV